MSQCDLLIKNGKILTADGTIETGKSIAIKDSIILDVTEHPDTYTAKTEIDDPELLWIPGLTDGHLHTSQQLLKGRLLDEKPVIWKRINVPFEGELTEETIAFSARLAAAEMLRSGTTSFVDAGCPHAEAAAEEYLKIGLRGALTWQTTDGAVMPESLFVRTPQALKRLDSLYRNYNNKGELLKVYYSITSLMACSTDLFQSVFLEAKEKGIPAECHMNEYSSEVYNFIEKYQLRPFEYLDKIGVLTNKFVAAHCILLSENEIQIIKDRGVRVVHCPFSNCGKGIPNTPHLLHSQIPVGFGTDGAAHGGLDLFREMRAFRCIMNAHHGVGTCDPQIMPAKTLLFMAAQNGAKVMMEEKLGCIQNGYLADIIAINLDQPHLYPTGNLVNTLVESVSGADVKHAIVHGKLLMKNRELLTIDEEKLRYQAHSLRDF